VYQRRCMEVGFIKSYSHFRVSSFSGMFCTTGAHACCDGMNESVQPGVEDECLLRYVA